MTDFHNLEDWLEWIDELSDKHYVVVDHFLSQPLYTTLKNYFVEHQELFTQAGIGSLDNHQVRTKIRGDKTYWLDANRDVDLNSFWHLVQETKNVLNRYCYLSLSGHEFHLAHYPPGGHYARHLDQFEERSNRMITMIVYLNDGWKTGDGGELEIFEPDKSLSLIQPLGNRCVLFKSGVVPHAVLKSHKDRYSLTGWLTYQPKGLAWI
ncbi:2OG-Fe(II) oxygenase [Croceivirga radicis]|uniref:2OG-Fe(II) oxygenase n=1 Tax=Croceivirga radicis TaxID=1929488 RepID=A0A1V6LVE0_9FLAO|nr:2OG-Fe(II) oxygenase [Croceivirga radicis]OQD44109.1 2OG-Fe(II) oxygenase [Croceivirga radicis]